MVPGVYGMPSTDKKTALSSGLEAELVKTEVCSCQGIGGFVKP